MKDKMEIKKQLKPNQPQSSRVAKSPRYIKHIESNRMSSQKYYYERIKPRYAIRKIRKGLGVPKKFRIGEYLVVKSKNYKIQKDIELILANISDKDFLDFLGFVFKYEK